MRNIKIILILRVALAAAIIGFIGCALIPPKGGRYYLPEKYAGWICVNYNIDGAPPLAVEDDFLVHKIPPSGILKTSSEPRFSPTRDEYYYYTDQGSRKAKELKHGSGYSKQEKGKSEYRMYFWISSDDVDADYEKYVKNRDFDSDPQCGPWRQ